MALKVGELYASFGIDSSGLDGALDKINSKCSELASSLTKTGAILSAAVTAPLVKLGKSIYDAGTSFYSQMSRVEAISGATESEIESLTAKAIEMGSTTSFTATEAGEALEYMAMAGWKSDQMLAGLAPIMDLAAASGEDLGSVSDIVTDALTAFGLTADDAAHFTDVLAATATSANTNVGMMGYTFQQVGALAGAMGYEVDDLSVAIGLMANAGIKGEKAGTQLRTLIANMADPTDEMAKAMKKLGISLTDSSGNMVSFDVLLTNLRSSFAGLSEDEKVLYASTLAGKEGMAGLLALVNASEADVNALTTAIENCNGATENMASTILDNAQGDVTIFKSAIEGLQITLWGLIEGPFRSVIQTATSLVDSFRAMDDETQTAILKVGALAAAAGPVLLIGSRIVSVIGKLVPAMRALASPVGIVAGAFALFAIAAVDANNSIGTAFTKMTKKVKKSLETVNGQITEKMKTVSDRLPALCSSIVEGIKDVVPAFVDTAFLAVTGFMDTISANASNIAEIGKTIITNIIGGISKNLPSLISSAATMVASIASALIRNIPSLVRSVGELVAAVWDGLKNTDWIALGKQIIDAIGEALSGLVDIFSGWFEKAKDAVKSIRWSGIWDAIKGAFKVSSDWLKKLILGDSAEDSTWADAGAKIWNTIKSGFKASGDWIKEKVLGTEYMPDSTWADTGKKIWETIKNGFTATSDWIKEKVLGKDYTPDASWITVGTKIWETIKNGFTATGDWIKAKILKDDYTPDSSWSDVGDKIRGVITEGLSKFDLSGITATVENAAGFVTSLVTKILEHKADTGASITTFVSGLVGDIAGWDGWATLADSFTTISTAIINGIVAAIPTVTNAAVDIINAIGTVLSGDGTTEFRNNFVSLAASIIAGIASAIPAISDSVSTIAIAIGDALKDYPWSSIVDNLTTLGDALFKAFAEAIKGATDVGASIVEALGNVLSHIEWDKLEISISGFADMVINGIVQALKAATTGLTNIANAIAELFGRINWEDVGDAAGTLATKLIDGIIAGCESLVPDMSALLTAIGNGIAAAGEGLGEAAGAIVNKLVEFALNGENWLKLIELGAKIIEGIATGIINLGKGILEGAWSFVSGVFKGLFDGLGLTTSWSEETEAAFAEMEEVVITGGQTIETDLENMWVHLNTINWVQAIRADTLPNFVQDYAALVRDGTPEVVASIQEFSWLSNETIVSLFETMLDTTKSLAERAAAQIALQDLGFSTMVSNSVASADKDLIGAVKELADDGVASFEEAFEILGITIPEAVKAGMDAGMSFVEASAAAVVEKASTANSKAQAEADAAATGAAIPEKLSVAEQNGTGLVTTASQGVVDASQLVLETLPDVAEITGEDTANAMKTGIDNGAGNVTASMDTLSSDVVNAALQEMSYETGYNLGYNFTDAAKQGIEAVSSSITSAMIGVANSVRSVASSVLSYSEGNSIGNNFADGIAAGIQSGVSAITSAAKQAAQTALKAAKDALGIKSPSRVAKKEIGYMYDAGLAEGILGKESTVMKAANRVAESLHDSFFVGDPSRGTVYTSRNAISQTAKKTAEATSDKQSLLEKAETIGRAIANRLLESGALEGDIVMDGTKVGERVATPVSKTIAKKSKQTIVGRSVQGVIA